MKYFTAIYAAVVMLSATAFAQYRLEYKTAGSTPLHYKAHTTLLTTETMMGQEARVSVTGNQKISMIGTRSGDKLSFDITVDSSSNVAILPSGDTNRTTSPSVGKTRRTVIRPDGEEISSAWLDSAFAQTQAGQAKEFGSFFFRLPDKEVSKGSSWKQTKVDTVNADGGGEVIVITTNSDYTLVEKTEVENVPCVKIKFSGKVSLKGSTVYQGMVFGINGTGTISGTAMFDYVNGRVVRIDGSSSQNLNMVSGGQNQTTIPMTQQTSYELSLVR